VRLKSVLLSFVTAGALVLSPVALTAPANAASVPSSPASISAPVQPNSYGKRICSSNGVMCIQRITSVDESGTAYVSAWANTVTWYGWFELYRNGSRVTKSKTATWEAGGIGTYLPNPLAKGGGWSMRAMQNPSAPVQIAEISFGV